MSVSLCKGLASSSRQLGIRRNGERTDKQGPPVAKHCETEFRNQQIMLGICWEGWPRNDIQERLKQVIQQTKHIPVERTGHDDKQKAQSQDKWESDNTIFFWWGKE
jgi:hypothetical protein